MAFQIYSIPSSSMENSLIPGDKVLVNKLAFGVYSLHLADAAPSISGLNELWLTNNISNNTQYQNSKLFEGYTRITVGDIVVFKSDHPDSVTYIKRCLGMPGKKVVLSMGSPMYSGGFDWNSYLLLSVNVWSSKPYEIKDTLNDMFRMSNIRKKDFSAVSILTVESKMSFEQIEDLVELAIVDSITVSLDSDLTQSSYLKSIDSSWTIYDFGPILVPQRDMIIKLNKKTFSMYAQTIRKFEKAQIVEKNSSYYLDGEQICSYRFKKNYYFLIGDNLAKSIDSRYFGFIPEENIIGRADMILFSYSSTGFKRDRFFLGLRH